MLLASGCGPVGPDHQVPGMELPATFSDGGVAWRRHKPADGPVERAWWKVFGDGTLNGMVERAMAANQEIKGAAARLDQSRAQTRAARTRFFPTIDLNPSYDRSQFRFRGPGGGSLLTTNISLPLDFSYEIDMWGKVRRQVEGAAASEEAMAETLRAMRLSVAGEVAHTYWALRAADSEKELLGKTVELRRKALGLLERQRDAGAISGMDYSRAETEVSDVEAQFEALDRVRSALVNGLAVLCGGVATGSAVAADPELPSAPPVPVSVPSELLRQRPDIRAAERRVAAANAAIGVAQAAFYPTLTLDASAGYDTGDWANLFDVASQVWSVGPRVSIPISAAGLRMAERDAAVAAHAAASADYRQTVLEAIAEVENALHASAALERQERAQQAAAASARRTLELSRQRFSSGLADFLDVVDAERTRLDAEQRARAVKAERLAVAVSLMKAMGGRW